MAEQSSLLQNAASAFNSTVSEAAGGLSRQIGQGNRNGGSETLEFPSNLESFNRPIIRFACTPHDPSLPMDSICLPLPGNLNFVDSATYDTINMGTISSMADIAKAATSAEGGIGAKVKAGLAEAGSQTMSGGAMGAAILTARKLGAEGTAKVFEFSSKQTVNPRTNTAFSGNTLRTFQFDFKMIASNEQETRLIDRIQQTFRFNTYASEVGGKKVLLQYPPLWTITFLGPDMQELEFVPKIYTCYLTQCTTVVNSQANVYRKDFSPHEIDVSLSFQESKVLTRNEMEDLQFNANRENADVAFIDSKTEQLKEGQNMILAKLAEDEKKKNNSDTTTV